jgi:orotate phosphoribosyltransferase
MDNKEDTKNLDFLIKLGAAVINDHVITPSGRHARTSFTKYKLYRHPKEISLIAEKIAKEFRNYDIQVVVGVSFGGAILSQLVAYHLIKLNKNNVLSLYLEYSGGKLVLRDNSNKNLAKGKRILIVDDSLNTGKTIKQTSSFVENLGSKVIGATVICNRNSITAEDLKIPILYSFVACHDIEESYSPENCPICKEGIPISKEFGVGT